MTRNSNIKVKYVWLPTEGERINMANYYKDIISHLLATKCNKLHPDATDVKEFEYETSRKWKQKQEVFEE